MHHGISKEDATSKLGEVQKAMVAFFLERQQEASVGLRILPGVRELLERLKVRGGGGEQGGVGMPGATSWMLCAAESGVAACTFFGCRTNSECYCLSCKVLTQRLVHTLLLYGTQALPTCIAFKWPIFVFISPPVSGFQCGMRLAPSGTR